MYKLEHRWYDDTTNPTKELTMATILTADLDIAFEQDNLLQALTTITADYESVTYRVIDGVGFAGWPVVRFVGAHDDMLAFVTDYCAGDRTWAYELVKALA